MKNKVNELIDSPEMKQSVKNGSSIYVPTQKYSNIKANVDSKLHHLHNKKMQSNSFTNHSTQQNEGPLNKDKNPHFQDNNKTLNMSMQEPSRRDSHDIEPHQISLQLRN